MPLISALSLTNRFTQLCLAAALLLGVAWFLVPSWEDVKHISIPNIPTFKHSNTLDVPPSPSDGLSFTSPDPSLAATPRPDHPINQLISEAEKGFDALLTKETNNVHDAAQAYRDRRGRQPPPSFDVWFAFAQNHSVVIVEEFFDQIYHDLAPFWGVPAKEVRDQAHGFIHRISVRDGNVTQRTDIPKRRWMDVWGEMVRSVAEYVPDVDLPINVMDESRVVVPWEEIDGYMAKGQLSRRVVMDGEVKTGYASLKEVDREPPENFEPAWEGMGPYWPQAVVGCPPESAARTAYIETDFSTPPPLATAYPEGSYYGYVQNWTLAKSPCDNPSLQGLHGTFVEPISIANTQTFFPLFGGSKLPMNNEILLPAAMYWDEDPFYSGGKEHGQPWHQKKPGMIWRGAASGGRNRESNWMRFQRHRFVSMVNSTSVHQAEMTGQQPPNFNLPSHSADYHLSALTASKPGSLSSWIATWANVAVVHLLCFPDPSPPHCEYTDQYYAVKKSMPMKEQYAHKYLPDIDGNSFSGRYRAFLRSTSLPIKATIYNEWHDSRLVPWVHFIPMDNTFQDLYGIMEYLLGNSAMGVEGHDDVAEKIAEQGRKWAEKVLRKDDMRVYVLRLLLEYARVCDESREVMGWKESAAG